ncbi:GyrI-like domain-containing protein [Desmospora profundinema]|uniref:Transcriptional regulator YdeE n=1 Tax=Desmospora profundinema TaxID=1571184 RepID=A0ABU1IQ17_9BACL|nr:GyrI-like domain-containing protein [Desmospora profundinema]MDR6226891.1 putative transcriptional regulator YdeE [Desmospora profundinema]
MEPRLVQVDPFTVRGIAVTTDNTREAGPEGKLPELWGRFYRHPIWTGRGDGIPVVYGVYHRYEDGMNGSYRVLAGCEAEYVQAGEDVEEQGVPASTYAVFTSDEGPIARVVPETWMRIWEWFRQTDSMKRTYQVDFERYDKRAHNPERAIVEIYISVHDS